MQPKRPRINPLILALALAAVLMVWSVMGSGSGSTSGSTMSYSTVVHYFEHNQVTAFTLDRNTSVITLNLKEGDLPLPDVSSAQSTVQSTGGLLSGMFSSSSESTGAVQEDDGTVTVRYKLPYAYVFIENVELGYSLPKELISKINVQRLRLYVSASNLFSIDNVGEYEIDPEIEARAAVVYPQQRTIMVGFNVTF